MNVRYLATWPELETTRRHHCPEADFRYGQSRQFGRVPVTSGLPRTTDIVRPAWHVSNVQNRKKRRPRAVSTMPLCSALPEKMDKLGRLPTEGRKCVKAQLPKVAPAGAGGLIFRRGRLRTLMRSGSISPTHFRLQFRAPPCFLHHAFRILRKCRKSP